jgi:hypothetical protein
MQPSVLSMPMQGTLSAIKIFLLIPNKACYSFLACTVKRNSLAWAEVLQVGVNLATNRKQGGSDSPLDSTSLLDGQNTAAAGMAGGILFSSQRDFNLVCVRLDRKRTIAAAFEPKRTGKHIMHKRIPFGHE